jgi:hypothetical protein
VVARPEPADLTTHQTGSKTASAANTFGQGAVQADVIHLQHGAV